MASIRKFLQAYGLWLAVGGAVALLHALLNGQYGFHRDELDILMSARQLDWGYVAYPPLTPLIARLGLTLFGNSLAGLRLFSALGQGVVAVLAGLMAADFGARRPAQVMAALAAFCAPVALTSGTLIQYMAFDYVWWVAATFCFVRLLKSDDPRWWLGLGLALGLGMETKYTIAFLALGLVAATLATAARRHLGSRWLWAGAGLALLIFLPNLIWQAQHHFISLEFLSAIHARDITWGRAADFLPQQILSSANPFTPPLWVAGLGACLLAPSFKRFRGVGLAFLVTFALLWLSRARFYYVGPAYVMLLAAGVAGWERWLAGRNLAVRRLTQVAGWGLLAAGIVMGVVIVKPIAPINSALWKTTSALNPEVVEMVGWDDLTAQVAKVYATIPAEAKPRTVILAGNYGEAGALDLLGPAAGLPRVISGANSLWARGYGSPEPETVIVVGFDRGYAESFFGRCEPAGWVTNRYGVKNEESTRHTGLYICRQPRQPWAEMWKTMQWYQ